MTAYIAYMTFETQERGKLVTGTMITLICPISVCKHYDGDWL